MKYLDGTKRGKFIVIYGSNNIGKSTQVGLLASEIVNNYHEQLLVVKYPVYGLHPTGPIIRSALKDKVATRPKFNPLEFQAIYAQNRRDFQDIIVANLNAGINVIAEDYLGTGIAWGMTSDVPLSALLKVNSGLLIPDISILMDGERFKSGHESHHLYESAGDVVWNKNRAIHLKLAKKFGWKIVKSDNSVEQTHDDIWKLVKRKFSIPDRTNPKA
ncbi:MAG: hypothetical protein NT141_03570 [candidate division WWE3 bacterium]|nr:hypothetical protein [candidate division WWE3 bacterium]